MKNLRTGGAFMKSLCFLLSFLVAFSAGLYGQEELSIQDIIDMVHAGLSDSFVLQKIRISTLEYEPTVEDLVELRRAGVSERIILALMGVRTSTRVASQVRYTSEGAIYHGLEVFGGYSFGMFQGNVDIHGWNVASAHNFNRWFGITLDGAGYYTQGVTTNAHTFLAGPQFSFRISRLVTPFVRGLVGYAHIRGNLLGVVSNASGLAYGGGGGVDLTLSDEVAVRVAQVDYIRIEVGTASEQLRGSVGIIRRW